MTEFNKFKGIGKDGRRIIFTMASGPVIIKNNKVLLDKHGDDKFWKFPGGKQNDAESCRENAIREVKEELNIDVILLDKDPCVLVFEREDKEFVFLVHYLTDIASGQVKKGRDVREYNWFSVNNLPSDVAPNIKPVLRHFGY